MSIDQSQYIFDSIIFKTNRLGFEEEEFDLKESVVELNLYENLELPYLTGSLVLIDNVAFKSNVGIQGSEKIEIKIKPFENQTMFERKFIVTGIESEVSVNERADVRVLTLIEEHAYQSAIQVIARTYTNPPEDIITDILKNYFDKEVNLGDEDGVTSFVSNNRPIKINVPYWNPLKTTDWLRDRLSTDNASPYFLFSTIRSDEIHLSDLNSIMIRDSWNSLDNMLPYTYAQTSHNLGLENDRQLKYMFHVKNYTASKMESTFRMALAGAITANYNILDLSTGINNSDNRKGLDPIVNGQQTLDSFIESIEPSGTTPSLAFDTSLKLGSSSLQQININDFISKNVSEVVSSDIFYVNDDKETAILNYHDEGSGDSYIEKYKNKFRSAQLRTMLTNNFFTITVPGQPYLLHKSAGVGTNINLNYALPSTDRSNEITSNDRHRSGKFLIYKTRHIFQNGIHDVVMDIVKLSETKER